jgi:hypothetical protein
VNRAGSLGRLTTAIGRAGGDIGAIDIVSVSAGFLTRDITVNASSSRHEEENRRGGSGVSKALKSSTCPTAPS